MLPRAFWMAVGAATGAWMFSKIQRAASRLTPSGAAQQASRAVRHLGTDISAALAEGRRIKRSTEAELGRAPRARPAIDVAGRAGLPSARPGEQGWDPR